MSFHTSDGVQTDQSFSLMHTSSPQTKHILNGYYNGRIGAWSIDLNADGFLLDANLHYQTKGHNKNIYCNGDYFAVNLTLTKSFLKNRLTAQLRVYNLLENSDEKFILYSGIRLFEGVNPQYRAMQLTLTYKFNTARSKYKGTGAGQEQKSRMERVSSLGDTPACPHRGAHLSTLYSCSRHVCPRSRVCPSTRR